MEVVALVISVLGLALLAFGEAEGFCFVLYGGEVFGLHFADQREVLLDGVVKEIIARHISAGAGLVAEQDQVNMVGVLLALLLGLGECVGSDLEDLLAVALVFADPFLPRSAEGPGLDGCRPFDAVDDDLPAIAEGRLAELLDGIVGAIHGRGEGDLAGLAFDFGYRFRSRRSH